MAQANILIQQLQSDGTFLIQYPQSLDTNIAYDNTETGYVAQNVNQAFLATLRAPQIQVTYNGGAN